MGLIKSKFIDLLNGAQAGDILYRGASAWSRLPKGADGQVLKLASGLPSWGNESDANILNANSGGVFSTISTTPIVVSGFTFAVEASKKYQVFISGSLRIASSSAYAVLGLQTPSSDYYLRGWKIAESTINTLAYEPMYVGGGSTNNTIVATNTTTNPSKAFFCCFTLITGVAGGNISLSLQTQDSEITAYISTHSMTIIG